MKKFLFVVLFAIGNVFALDTYTVPFIAAVRDTLTKTRYNMNNDTAAAWANRATDTINSSLRIAAFKRGDNTVDTFRVNKIRSNPNIDSIDGRVVMDTITNLDSIYSEIVKVRKIYIDTMRNRVVHNENGVDIYTIGNDTPAINTDVRLNFSSSRPAGFISKHSAIIAGYSLSTNNDYSYMAFQTRLGGDSRATWLKFMNGTMWYKGNFYDTGMVAATNLLTNYIQFGTAANSKCSVYVDTTFKDTLYKYTSPPPTYTYLQHTTVARIVKVGASVTLYQPGLQGTLAGSEYAVLSGIPIRFYPATECRTTALLYSNGGYIVGLIEVNFDGRGCLLVKIDSTPLDNGSSGLGGDLIIHWIK